MPRVENPALTEALAARALPEPPVVLVSPDNSAVAIKTADNVPSPWFVFHPGNGGQYAADADVEGWTPIEGSDAGQS